MLQNNSAHGNRIKIILIHVIGLFLFYAIVGFESMSESKEFCAEMVFEIISKLQ